MISMLPMITTGFGYGYSLRHSSVVSAFTAHTLTNSFVNHPPPHPSGCGYNMVPRHAQDGAPQMERHLQQIKKEEQSDS